MLKSSFSLSTGSSKTLKLCLAKLAKSKACCSLTYCQRSWLLVNNLLDALHVNSTSKRIMRIRKERNLSGKENAVNQHRPYCFKSVSSSLANSSGSGKLNTDKNAKRSDHMRTVLFMSFVPSAMMPCSLPWIRFYSTNSPVHEENISTHSVLEILPENDVLDKEHRESDMVTESLPAQNYEQPASDLMKKGLPELSGTTYNLAPFVERSVTLKSLVRIGVDLSKIEKVKGMAELLVKSDFDKHILPYLRHLANVGVKPDKLGYIVSVNPLILKESLIDLEQRVGYLLSKKFSLPDVASMFSRAPVMMSMDPVKLDSKFGFLQSTFKLSGFDVRLVALTFPKLLPWRKEKIADIRFTLKEFMSFSDKELKLMLIREPKLFTANKHKVLKAFDYISNSMLLPHEQIVQWPAVLRRRLHITKSRHLFLLFKGRAQYDPCKENYVSMKAMLACNDAEFCENLAKSDVDEYYKFLKTL